jgi:D-inositol-3-phosphate glycosyltransferase
VLTIASERGDPNAQFMDRCRVIAVQTEGMQQRLRPFETDGRRIRLIYPGIDLSCFTPRDTARGRGEVRILFATFPRTAAELESRGVLLLLDIARQFPQFQFSVLSRPWNSGDTSLPVVKQRVQSGGLRNVTILEGVQSNMEVLYKQHDFTVIPFTTPDGGKECPRSLVETLACGVPVLISEIAPFSQFVAQHDCGRVFPASAAGFATALEEGLRAYPRLSRNAALCARTYFDRAVTMKAYADIYRTLSW